MQKIDAIYSLNPLDRLDQTRGKEADFKSRRALDSSIFLVFSGNELIVHDEKLCEFSTTRFRWAIAPPTAMRNDGSFATTSAIWVR